MNWKCLRENIEKEAKYDFENHKVFGSAYLVGRGDETITLCFGNISLHSEHSVTNKTLFRLASMTKPITAVATLILAERGLLSLDDGVDRYLPEFREVKIIDAEGNARPPRSIPTLRHILTHTSGIGSNYEKLSDMTQADRATLDAAIAYYRSKGLDFEPGTTQMYSGVAAFDVLTKIIETVSGRDYLTFLKDEILLPLGMTDTTFLPTEEQWSRMVRMHNKRDGESAEFAMHDGCVFESTPATHFLGGAGLASTLSDYAKFARMLLRKGTLDGVRILSEQSVALMSTPYFPTSDNESWGLGVRVITSEGYPHLPVGSFGWSGAYGSHFWIDPQNDLFAVFMKNSMFDGGAANKSAVGFERAVYS
jgi:CubicO group peptidase (beta-lactamase class C family)